MTDHTHAEDGLTPEQKGERMWQCGCPHCVQHIVAGHVPVSQEIRREAALKMDRMEEQMRREMAHAAAGFPNYQPPDRSNARADILDQFRAMRGRRR